MVDSVDPAARSGLAHFVVGEGRRGVVLLHGFLGSGKNLRGLAQAWVARDPDLRILVPDLPGHGGSPPLAAQADLAQLADAVLHVVADSFPGERIALVGHSLGGRVALEAAGRFPERLAEVVLLDIGPGPLDVDATGSGAVMAALLAAPAEAPDRRAMRDSLTGRGLSAATADWLLMNLEGSPAGGYRWRFDRSALAAFHRRGSGEDLWPVVEARPLAIRCIRGGRSRHVSDADAERLRAAGCRVDTLAEAGHYLHVDALPALIELL